MDIIIFITVLSLIYLVCIYYYFFFYRRKRKKIQGDYDVVYAKRKELQETDVYEYLTFKEYSEKRMNQDFKDT